MPPLPRPSQLARIAAVTSSIVLVGLYVAYRSGGQTTIATTPPTALPGSKGGVIHLNTTTVPTTGPVATTLPVPAAQFQVISGSKFLAPVFKPSTFSGSKSAAVFHPSDTTLTLTTQPATGPSEAIIIVPAKP